ncbi:MAG: hypothetical protein OEX19_01290 [Gammaproteobacteria bacterium]|nr:hypothetical protein [Gammaproteobacteria bacterium]
MKRTLALLSCLLMLPGLGLAAEGPAEADQANHAFGGSLGWLTGSGIMYRRYMGDNYLQGGAVAYYNKDTGRKYGDLAIMVGRYVHYTNFSEQFFPVALKVFAGGEIEVGRETENPDTYLMEKNDYLHTGAGIGVDIGNPNQAGFSLSLDISYIASFRDFEFNGEGLVFIEPRPGASIFYNW